MKKMKEGSVMRSEGSTEVEQAPAAAGLASRAVCDKADIFAKPG